MEPVPAGSEPCGEGPASPKTEVLAPEPSAISWFKTVDAWAAAPPAGPLDVQLKAETGDNVWA